jgi:hypothetical protein
LSCNPGRKQQLLESAMRLGRPRFAVGHTTSVDNTEARYEWCLALMGGGQAVGGAELPSTRVLQRLPDAAAPAPDIR